MNILITILVLLSAYFEGMAYFRQIRKTVRLGCSNEVSLKSYGDKLKKYVVAEIALILSANYVGLILEIFAMMMCIVAYITIKRNKGR